MLELKDVRKRYGRKDPWILSGVDLTLKPGEGCVIRGRSGSGKTTLLHLISGLEPLNGGAVSFNGHDISSLSSKDKAQFRNQHVGFCFQHGSVISYLTVLENIILPLLFREIPLKEARRKGEEMLERLNLSNFADERPEVLSGGQLQRLDLGRALIGNPDIILADEPTGNLDRETAEEMINLILQYHRELNACLLLVTHDIVPPEPELISYTLKGGKLFPDNLS